MNRSYQKKFLAWSPSGIEETQSPLINEEPLLIKIEDTSWSVILRTPGDEREHVAGLCLAEGIVGCREEFTDIQICPSGNTATVRLQQHLHKYIPEYMKRQGFMSRVSDDPSCEKAVNTLKQFVKPTQKTIFIPPEKAHASLEGLSKIQPLREKTRAAHAAAIYDASFRIIAISEDVGRHNALDKSIGKLLLAGNLDHAAYLVLSSRISYELVQKAARANIPIILSMSRPTAFAVKLAEELNITTACLAKKSGLYIFTGEHRFERQDKQ